MHANNNIVRSGRNSFSLLLLFLCALLAGSCTNRQAMQERLGYVSSCNRADTVFTVRWLPAVDSLVCYFDHHGTPNERLMAYYLQGRVHHDMGEAPQAIDCYQKAVEQADTTADDCDYHTLTAVYGQMAQLYRNQFLPDDEIAALRLAARMANLEHNTLSGIIAIQRLAGPYFMKSDTDSVLIVEKQARELYLKHGYPEYAAQAVLSSIWIALNRQDLTEAERLLTLYRNESGLFDNNGESARGGAYYLDKGIYMTHLEMLDSALYYFHKAIKHGLYEGGYKGLLSVYEKMNRPDSISKYARLFAAANDSSFLHVNQETVHRISALYNYSRQQRIAEEQAEQARRANLHSIIILSFTLILLIAFLFSLKVYRDKQRQKQLELDLLKNTFAETVERYEQKKLELEKFETKSKELNASYEEEKAELAEQVAALQGKIDEMKMQKDMSKYLERSATFCNTAVVRQIKELASNPFNLLEAQQQKELINTTGEFFADFVHDLFLIKDISQQSVAVCILAAMNFRTDDIAHLLNVSGQRITNVKRELNKALFDDGNARSLTENIKRKYNIFILQ